MKLVCFIKTIYKRGVYQRVCNYDPLTLVTYQQLRVGKTFIATPSKSIALKST
jgi:hypothetical protein